MSQNRDYVAERRQHEDLGVPKYWIVAPQEDTYRICFNEKISHPYPVARKPVVFVKTRYVVSSE